MKIISVSGLIGSGKDSIASHLIQNHGYQKASFSKALKDIVATLFGWDRDLLEGLTQESREWREIIDEWWSRELGTEVTPRHILQFVGTEVMRNVLADNIWVLVMKKYLTDLPADAKIVIPDARFFNEMGMIRDLGGVTVGVHRKLPSWLDKFYSMTDSSVRMQLGKSFSEADLNSVEEAKEVRAAAQMSLKVLGVKLHQSEWEHLLWNGGYTLVNNDGSLADLYEQVDKLA